jgi:hypothetical protein
MYEEQIDRMPHYTAKSKELDITTMQNHNKLKKGGGGITARISEDSK